MHHDTLKAIIERYTPTMFDVTAPASKAEIKRMASHAGELPPAYTDFLGWMGARCPFLDGEQLIYSPDELIELAQEAPEVRVPDGFLLVGVDTTGSGLDLHIRLSDGGVCRLDESFNGGMVGYVPENVDFESFLLTSYVRKTLVPSHPYHLAGAVKGEESRLGGFIREVEGACGNFVIDYPVARSDLRFWGGADFVVGLHRRPGTEVVYLYAGATDRVRHEQWYDLAFEHLKCIKMPV